MIGMLGTCSIQSIMWTVYNAKVTLLLFDAGNPGAAPACSGVKIHCKHVPVIAKAEVFPGLRVKLTPAAKARLQSPAAVSMAP